jgi:alkylation response protein AidB-like acyl-CoA dehydrogenase
MATSDVITNLLHQVERIRPLIKEHATSAEANRQLSRVVYDAMYEAGLFAMLAPKAHGGPSYTPSRPCAFGRPSRASTRPRPGTW